MASDFLKNMAQRQAEKIDKEYGSDAYGGSNWRQQQAAGGGTTAQAQQVSGASSFLRSQAQKARERVDAEYGPDAYGGSNYQFSVKPASSFAQIDETAPAFERYEQVAAELTSGQEKLTTSRAQLDTLRSAYDADPTEANATAYNRSLAQFQADLEAYNDLVDQYTYFNSLEGIQERVDELTPLVEAAEKERNEARTVMTGIQRYGTEDQRAEWSAKLEAAEADYERYSKALNDLAAQYYYAENQAKRESLDASEDMSSLYNEATMLQEDMDKVTEVMAFTFNGSGDAAAVEEYKKYLAEKYGLDQKAIDQYAIAGAGGAYTPRTDGGYNNIYELYQELEEKKKQAVERMAAEEYDYDRMAQFEQMQRDAEEYEKSVQEWETWAKEHPILSSAETVLVSPFQGIDYLKTMVGGIGTSDPSNLQTYVPMNVYNMDATNFVSTVRGTVSKEIEENTDWELFGQNVASFLYQTGMSVADSAVQVGAATALGVPTAATFFMGASAASNQAKDVIERGGTNEQAFWGGLAAGAAEALFEKVSIDRLLSVHSVSSMKDLLKETVKQAGVEASEEMLTEISNIITDAAIMGDKSNFEAMVDQYEMQGLSEDEAKKQALLDSIGQVAWAGAGGALSGAAMGGVVNTMNYAGDAAYNRQQNQAAGEQFQQMGDDVVAAIIEEGLASDPSTRSYQLAQQIQNKQAQGQQVTAQELGELYQENVRTVAQEQSRQEAQEPEGLSLPTVESVLEETERADPVTVQRGAIQSETTPEPAVSPLEAVRNGQVQEPEAAPETAPGAQRTPVADILNGGVTNGTEGTAQGAAVQGTGAGVLGGDVGRISGTGTGGQTGGLEGSAGARRRSEQVRAASARQDRVNALQVTPVSSREMGLTSGTDARTVKPVPQQAYDEAMQATAQRFEQAGYTVTYFTGLLQVSTPAGPVRVNGAVQGSRVYIQADNMRWSIDQIGNHEQFHIEAAADPGLVEAVRDEIISRFSEEQFSGIVETYIQKLRGVIDIPENATDAEIDAAVRDILEEIFADAYAGKNAFSAGSTEYTQAVRDVVDQRSAGRREETTPARGPPEERYSFAGRNANRADQEALARAEEMERAGEDAEQIRQETGWFRGADGLWRFEIDDSGMEYDPTGDLQGARSRRWAMEDLEAAREDLFGNITEEQADMVRAYNRAEIAGDTAEQQRLYDELTATEFGFQFETYVDALQRANATKNNPWGGTLADYINHPELFANYPQLRDVGLEFRKLPEGTRGEFDGDTVTLDESLLTEPEDVLIHEIQHAIQRAEGFARGASPEYWSRQLQNGYDGRTENVRREAARLRDEYNSVRDQEPEFFDAMIELEEMTPDVPRGAVNWDTLEQIEEDPIEWQQYDAAREAAEQRFGREKVWGFITLLQHLKRAETDAGRSAYNLYRDTAGEIEARDAAARRSMDREQRRNTRPNIGNEDTVFSDADAFANAEGTDALKEQQMQVIQESNPAQDDYHTWIRSAEEIKTLQEAITDPEWAEYDEFNPDYSRAMAEEALESGEIEVFSSYPIEAGGFVTPSRMEAESYAGDGRVYSRRVPVTDVAWIDPTQGQYAPTGRARYSVEDAATEDNQGKELTKEQQEFFRGSQIRDRQGRLREVYHGTNSGEFTVFDWSETQRTDGGWFGRGFYFTFYQGEARMYGQRVLPAYLNIKNPFVFDEQMFTIEGMKPETTEGSSVAFIINFAEKLPELAEGRTLEVVTGWDDEGYGIVKNIPWSELRAEIEPILNNPTFTIQEVQDAYRGNYYQWFLKTGKGKYDYSQSRAYYETKEMAEKYRFDAAVDFLFNSIYYYADLHMAHYYIEDIGTEFTEALKTRGYDGVLQTRDGDEVVAFYPEQIKRVDNRQPTENPDIRYSVDEDQDAAEALLAATDDGSGEYSLSRAALRQDTNLQRRIQRAQAMTQTDAFRRWFNGSKVQNTAGGPLLVFHGAGGRFTAFNTGGRPMWFTPNAAYAGSYATQTGRLERAMPASQIYTGGARMIPAYLHVENPADVGQVNTPFEAAAADLAERTGIPEAEWRDTWNAVGQPAQTWEVINTQEAASLLQEHGYDGIVAREGDTRTYAAFDPGQVKSAVANRGTFNRENPDIRFSVDEETDQEYNALEKSEGVILGDQDETYTEGNTPVQFTYAIVPAEALVVSNDEYGSVNPAYPAELQPRDRSRTASQVQIQEMSRNLNPRLLADSPTAQNGAPIIRGDGAVIGGNARSQAIIAAYNSGRAAEYEQFVRERGKRYGLDTSSLPQHPVLVRMARNVQDWGRLAQELNAATTAAYSTTEQAMTDAARMGDILDLIVPNDEGTINNEANKAFINQFIQQVVPAADRGGMTTATGMLSQAGLERAQYAVFARAYGDPALLARLSESLDNDAKNVTKALLDTAANAVAMRTAIEEGTAYNVPVVDGIINAVNIYTQAKSRNQTVQEYTDQASLLEQYPAFDVYLAQFIENNKRSGKQIRTMLNNLYDQVQEYGDPQQESIFGGEEHGLQETLERAISRYESETGRQIGRPDFGRDLENREMAAGSGEQGVLQQGPDVGDPGRSRKEDTGNDEGGEPEGLNLPEVEPEPDAEGTVEPEIQPALDYRERLREAIEQPTQGEQTAGEPGDLYRDEDMTDEQYNALNERWRENQQRRQRQNLRLEDFATVDEYTAALEQRAAQEKAERMKNVSKEDFTGTPALERLGVKVENSVGIYDFIPSLIESDRAAKSIRKEMRRAERRLNATAAERNFASGVAAGIYSQEDIPSTMNAEKVMELADYYWAERAVSADLIRQQRADINKALSEKMQELFKDSDAFKPSRSIILNHRTPERNMLHIFGDERGAAINAAIFDPVAANEAERIRFRNRMHDEVRAFEDSAGKTTRLTKEERAVVQQVIEGRAVGEIVAGMEMSEAIQNAAQNIRNGEDAGDAAKEFSLDREQRRLAEKYSRWLETQEILESGRVDNVKVENAVAKYKSMFDQFYDAINDFLVAHGYEPIGFIKGYAPHIQPENNQNLLNKSLQAMGINTDVTRLPSSIAGLTADYRPNKRWNPYFLQRTSDITEYDIATAYESYVDYMSDVLYHTDDIMRVRQAANYFRRTYAPDEIRENLSWAEELRYRSTDDKAAFLRDHDVISKTSAMTPGDISQAMDDYVDKLYEDITRTTKYSEFVSYLDNYANILAGKQSMADRGWEYSSGRTILNLGNKLVRAFGRAQVAGNLSSALNQTAQLPQIFAELGTKNTAQAIADIWSGKLRRAGWAQESDFLTGKKGIDYLVTDPADMVVSTMFKPAEFMDGFVSTVAVRGKYLQEIQAGKSEREAMKAADAWGKSVMGSRAKGSRPLTFEAKNPVAQMVNVFQVEAINSWEHLTQDLPRDFRAIERSKGKTAAAAALAGVIVKMLLAAFLLNRAAEETYGGTPAPFDILGLSANFIASGEGLTTNEWLRTVMDNGWEKLTGERLFDTDPAALDGDFNWGAAAEDFAYNASNDIPYLRNVTGLLGLGDETLPLPDLYGAGEGIVNAVATDGLLSMETLAALGAAAAEFLPGGRQVSKTVQGLSTVLQGGRYYGSGDGARLQYPVEGDFFDVVRAAMFGNSALEETNEFYASGESGLSAAQTKLYEDLVAAGADRMELYRGIQDYRGVNNDEGLSSLERGKQERDIIRAMDLTDEQKLTLYRGLTGADSRAEKFQALMDAGMTWDEVMDAYDRYAELDADEDMKATDKATELARWADERYQEDQAAAVKEQLAFFSIIPAQAERYAALTEAGLDTESAYNLTEIFAGLEPEEGSDTVSNMQRYKAVVTSNLSDQEQLSALGTLMGESEYAKVETGFEFGVTPAMYVQARENVAEIDENGSTSQDEATRAISSIQGLTARERAVLWQLQNKSWKATNNPYDTATGQQVYNALHAGDETETIELPRLGQETEETELPTISLPRLG